MLEKSHDDAAAERVSGRLDWNLLRTFLVISQEKSISAAAIKLNVTQSAVSQALRRLEAHLDKRLIERHHSRFAITLAGEEVRRAAETIYGNVAELVSDVMQAKEEAIGRIHVLTASRIHSAVYDEFWSQFHRRYPRIEVNLDVRPSSEIVSILQRRGGTAGIGLCRQKPAALDSKIFLQQRYAIFCGANHHLYGRRDCQVEDLLGENFVSFSSDVFGDSLSPLAIFRDEQGFSGNIVATSSHHDEVKRLLIAGFGIGCLPEHSVKEDVGAGRLWRLPPEDGVCTVELHFLWNKTGHRSMAESLFIREFSEHLDRYTLDERLTSYLPGKPARLDNHK
ncbi:LysR family transcriptional regulator [Cupriavidus sp. H39]|uniref:LysR family transcriptional regulator n=1 Tax=Cupriavidus sp. H39 TaxID=3401635 RepID=UPI003D008A4E